MAPDKAVSPWSDLNRRWYNEPPEPLSPACMVTSSLILRAIVGSVTKAGARCASTLLIQSSRQGPMREVDAYLLRFLGLETDNSFIADSCQDNPQYCAGIHLPPCSSSILNERTRCPNGIYSCITKRFTSVGWVNVKVNEPLVTPIVRSPIGIPIPIYCLIGTKITSSFIARLYVTSFQKILLKVIFDSFLIHCTARAESTGLIFPFNATGKFNRKLALCPTLR